MKNPWAIELCLAKILSDSGYYTLLTGKWHIGESDACGLMTSALMSSTATFIT
jgi:arylsulfatase A-like enzyme